jgi:hypothetical protein
MSNGKSNMWKALIQISVIIAPMVGALFVGGVTTLAQTVGISISGTMTRPRPLADVAELLEELYRRPVTYEEIAHLPRYHSFSIPFEINREMNPNLDSRLLGQLVDAYNLQSEDSHYAVSSSSWGLHIVPIQERSLLDVYIDVPEVSRTPSEHIQAICDAVGLAMGIALDFDPMWIDQYFAPTGLHPPRVITNDIKKQISFVWGARRTKARNALIDLLEQSSTTLTWHLFCVSESSCTLNVLNLNVVDGSTKRPLLYDRREVKPWPGGLF